jgi:hypothetical protein
MRQGETVGDSKEGFGMRLVHEQGGVVDEAEEHVEMVVVDMLVTVMVEGGATVGHVVGGGRVGDRETVTVEQDEEPVVGLVVGTLVTIHEHALESREVEARHGLAKGGMLGVAMGLGRKVLQKADAELR